jgi:2,3,4,5-tetrahydropyridine-2,6-dicarboxylate N-succinyltransferase
LTKLFRDFKAALNRGEIRAAEPDASTKSGWRANAWVKKGILLGFRMGAIADMSIDAAKQPFFDKSTYPVRAFTSSDGVRIVPGGSSIRDGSYIGRGVICMPPMFVNVGAYVGEGTMIDSHALVGSCAQIGRNCHISAGSQIGGVLEPVGALPVIIEDDVMVGGNAGIYEGTVVKRRAVLGTGTILNRSIPVYDLVRDKVYTATETELLIIPEEAIVVPGSRAVSHPSGLKWGLSLQAAVIVKYRDSKTDARIQLEDLLR